MADFDAGQIAAMFATDADFEIDVGRASLINTLLHQQADTMYDQRLELIFGDYADLFLVLKCGLHRGKRVGFNRSMQLWLEAYSREFQTLTSFAGLDGNACQLCRTQNALR